MDLDKLKEVARPLKRETEQLAALLEAITTNQEKQALQKRLGVQIKEVERCLICIREALDVGIADDLLESTAPPRCD